jgi:hypothetical protein
MDIQREKNELDAADAKAEAAFETLKQSQGMKKCSECECWVNEEDLVCGICESCVDDIITRTTVDQVADYASTLYDKHSKEDTELLLYTDYLFTREEAIEILKKAAKEAEALCKVFVNKRIREYIENDIEDYVEYLDKKGGVVNVGI